MPNEEEKKFDLFESIKESFEDEVLEMANSIGEFIDKKGFADTKDKIIHLHKAFRLVEICILTRTKGE